MKSGLDRVAARLGRAKPLAALLLGVLVLAGVVSVLVATGILAPDALRGTGAAVSGVSQGVRYVKVRLRGQNYLSLAEVQVFSAEDPLYNFAYQQPATQSSTFSDPKCQPTADRAVDGNMNGDMYANCSVTATNNDQGAWWQVDVGNLKIEQVGRIVLWNRTDCCPERLSDFDVQVSADGVSWTTIYSQAGAAPNMLEIRLSAVTVPGFRYVKVQLRGQNYLSLAEVQVYSGGTNVALNKPASQSSTFADPRCQPTANRAVDGNTGGDFYAQCGVTATNNDQSAWWQVDLGLNYNVERIVLFNRTDCCPERLSNFDVLASGDGISWAIVSYQAGVAPSTLEIGLPVVTAPSPGPLRFVKVQLRGQNYLSLAEFQAFVGSQNVALNKPASQSSTFIDPKCQVPANRAVDGNISGDYYTYCSVTATNNDQGAWWQV
ncbi:MAG: discoidin domain-containing protein, partial [Chloroflexi bacterium]|nr:discoidin domain-containing protein [Chloroflexota bacterium]